MADRLVTVATFDQPAQARLAENALKEAGIRVAVSDESLVVMDWLLSNAGGGVKVHVWEEDAERAVAVLEQQFGERGEGLGAGVAPEELAAQAEGAEVGEGEQPEADLRQPAGGADADEPADPEGREAYARRAAFTGILILVFVPFWFFYPLISFVFFPLAFYAMYLALNAAFGPGPLSGRGRLNVGVGAAAILLTLSWFFFIAQLVAR